MLRETRLVVKHPVHHLGQLARLLDSLQFVQLGIGQGVAVVTGRAHKVSDTERKPEASLLY